ncbi:hypothetical protein PTKIN_Ptkin07bG0020000 [Pterospermum kingtungense]
MEATSNGHGVAISSWSLFAIDMCLGTLIVFIWQKLYAKKAEAMVLVIASGLICGEGLWISLTSILALAKINPPICMKILPS